MNDMVQSSIMESKAFQVRPTSSSLRATIPEGIVKTLKLSHGDTIIWEIEARNGNLIAVVKKGD